MNYIPITESSLDKNEYTPLRTVFLMIRCGDHYLLKRDADGGYWELPATGIKAGETPRECVARKYGGKYDLSRLGVTLIGVSPVVFEEDRFSPGSPAGISGAV